MKSPLFEKWTETQSERVLLSSWPLPMTYGTFGSEISKGDDLQSTGWVVLQHACSVASPIRRDCGAWCTMGSEGPRGTNTSPLLGA